jgi:two-component system, cell cycle response regulator
LLYLLRPFPLQWEAEELRKLEAFVEKLVGVEPYFEGHIQRACFYALNFGKFIGLSEGEIRQLYRATFFHDAGKVGIPTEILEKTGALAPEEMKIMRTHPSLGAEICLELGPLEEIAPLVAAHHEKLDGTGYPRGLAGEDIPLLARILAIIEIYDALRSERCYKAPFSLERSLEILRSQAQEGQMDKELVHQFARFGERQYVDPHILSVDVFSSSGATARAAAILAPPCEAEPGSSGQPASKDEEEPITVLVAEDHPDQLEILETLLRRSRYHCVTASDGEEAIARLAEGPVDIAVLDIMMPKMSGLEVCRRIRENPQTRSIYVIFLTALVAGEDRVRGLELGGDDYITKPFYVPELLARLSVGERLTREKRQREREAAHDGLTGLYNRRMFEERLGDEFDRARRYRRPLSVLMIDIDDFKQVNDTHGHDCGDHVLRKIAQILTKKTRKSDVPVRYGGEEFVLILPETHVQDACRAGEKLRNEVKAQVFNSDSSPFSVTISLGVASTSVKAYQEPQALLKDADIALYKAKRRGKDRVESVGAAPS